MKKFYSLIIAILLIQPVFAENYAKLRVHISGATDTNKYFLCVSNTGCVSIKAGNHGTTYPMSPGNINYILPMNIAALHIQAQPLPSSCNLQVKNGQVITVSGKLKTKSPNQVYLADLNCKVG